MNTYLYIFFVDLPIKMMIFYRFNSPRVFEKDLWFRIKGELLTKLEKPQAYLDISWMPGGTPIYIYVYVYICYYYFPFGSYILST